MAGPPRIPPRRDAPPEVARLLDATRRGTAPPLNVHGTLAHHPRLLEALACWGPVLADGLLPGRERELIMLRVGHRCRCEYEFGQHTLIGLSVGLSEAEIARITTDEPGWSDGDALLIRLADEIHDRRDVTDGLWEGLRARWNEAELIEMVTVAGFYDGWACSLLNTLRVQLDAGVPGWPAGGVHG